MNMQFILKPLPVQLATYGFEILDPVVRQSDTIAQQFSHGHGIDPQKCMQHVLKQTNWPAEWEPQLEALRENFEAVDPDLDEALCLVKQFELLPGEKRLAGRQEKRPLQGASHPSGKRVRNCSQ